MATTVVMDEEWTLGSQLGEGGFGQVFEARSPSGELCVIKLVPKAPGADRETLFVNLDNVRHVVAVVEIGETSTHWALRMPKAERSLREYLTSSGPLTQDEALAILLDLAETLSDLEDRVVHRDIKPENILHLNGHWALADFGAARWADATTSANTHKFTGTDPYVAPERWRLERASAAADVYAVGVVAFELMSGSPPFPGPTQSDYREQHLHEAPPDLPGASAGFGALVDECLFKGPASRPSPENLVARIQRAQSAPTTPGLAALQEINRQTVARNALQATAESAAETRRQKRAELREAAEKSYIRIASALETAIMDNASTATRRSLSNVHWELRLGQAVLTAGNAAAYDPGAEAEQLPFDVVAYTSLDLTTMPTRSGYRGRNHSLWFCDAVRPGEYKWVETAFMESPLKQSTSAHEPFNLPPGYQAVEALSGIMGLAQVAWPFTVLDVDDLDSFIDRWAEWFAAGASGALQRPSQMPERDPAGSWRRG